MHIKFTQSCFFKGYFLKRESPNGCVTHDSEIGCVGTTAGKPSIRKVEAGGSQVSPFQLQVEF